MNGRIDIDSVFASWKKDDSVEAGRVIFESIKKQDRPTWAANVLQRVVNRAGIKSIAVENILRCAKNPEDWKRGHKAFSLARDATLKLEEKGDLSSEQELLLCTLLLAELVAKVTYNATDPIDEFDEDSGWWIAGCLKDILQLLGDDKFSEIMWSTLCPTETGS
jgi:hypothetical protein